MTSRQNIKLSAAQRLVMQPLTDAAMREALDEFELVCENNDVRKLTDAEKYAAQEFALGLIHGDTSAPVAYAEATDKRAPTLILTAAQLLEALDFIAPDRTADQFESEVSFQYGKGHSGEGIYCWITEYPDEGASLLDGSTVAAQAVAADSEAPDELLQLDKLLADFHTTVWHAGAGDNGPIDFDIAGKDEAKAIQRHVRAMLNARAAVSPATADQRAAFETETHQRLKQLVGDEAASMVKLGDGYDSDYVSAAWIGWQSHASQAAAPASPATAATCAGMPDEVRDSLLDSQYLAGVTAGWNAANADDPNAALEKIHASHAGYLKPLRDWQKDGRPGVPATPATAAAPLNGIPATRQHDEGAIARCSYCGRYSIDPKTLGDRQPKCECGEKYGWSGSFERPGPNAKWSDAAPASMTATAARCTLIPLSERQPIADDHPRVIVFTDGSDFNGAQFFDVPADSINECFYESPDDQPEVCRHATHWMPRPSLRHAAPATADERAANPIKTTERDHSFIDNDLDFEPDAQHAVADMANIGYALMQTIERMAPGYCWNESPTEIVSDLINERDEARASRAAAPAEAREHDVPEIIAASNRGYAAGLRDGKALGACGPLAADAGEAVALTAAARDVLAERARQVSVEGWTPEHDDQYTKGELALAASQYVLHVACPFQDGKVPAFWPWPAEWWKPTTPRRDLEKAGALIQAEIERLYRAEAREQGAQGGKGGE
ncbi:hypothetical protein [Burkholderia gladioli]|uniref:hypothetical protein n=1 Tax=Burkholderia gladioli TaxID=28095 RepID=UPI001FC7E095|nr:hypothetical protein [Burkholderia gladioli]